MIDCDPPDMIDSKRINIANEALQAAIGAALATVGPSLDYSVDAATAPPKPWQTWVIGLAFITLCSFSAPVGILMLPCLARWLYERIMCFLIALGIGTLTGSCFFIMIPQAFGLAGGLDYSQKAWIMVASLYGFFTIDRILQYVFEIKRRRVRRFVRDSSLMDAPRRQETIETVGANEERDIAYHKMSVDCRRRYVLDIPVLNTMLARTMDVSDSPSTPSGSRRGDLPTVVCSRMDVTFEKHHESHKNSSNMLIAAAAAEKKENEDVSRSVPVMEQCDIDNDDLEISSIAYIIIVGSSLNNFFDGMSMGAVFAGNLPRGVLIGISSFSQQFPQEVGTLAIIANSGLGIKRTLLVNLIPAFLSYLGFAIGVILDNVDASYKSYVLSVSAGMYLYLFLGTLIPEVRVSTEELIKSNLPESLLVTFLQFLGMGGGVTFMYFMNKFSEARLSGSP